MKEQKSAKCHGGPMDGQIVRITGDIIGFMSLPKFEPMEAPITPQTKSNICNTYKLFKDRNGLYWYGFQGDIPVTDERKNANDD